MAWKPVRPEQALASRKVSQKLPLRLAEAFSLSRYCHYLRYFHCSVSKAWVDFGWLRYLARPLVPRLHSTSSQRYSLTRFVQLSIRPSTTAALLVPVVIVAVGSGIGGLWPGGGVSTRDQASTKLGAWFSVHTRRVSRQRTSGTVRGISLSSRLRQPPFPAGILGPLPDA